MGEAATRGKMVRFFLAVLFIVLISVSCQAAPADCGTPKQIHSYLVKNGVLPFAYGMTDNRYIITIYVGDNIYVITAEDDKISCILTTGKVFYLMRSGKA